MIAVIARTTDPETSHEAAAEFEQSKAQRSIETVVCILEQHGPLTDFEIRDKWTAYWGSDKWSYTLPCKARHWARQAGLIKHDGFGIHQKRKVRRWNVGKDDESSTHRVIWAALVPDGEGLTGFAHSLKDEVEEWAKTMPEAVVYKCTARIFDSVAEAKIKLKPRLNRIRAKESAARQPGKQTSKP